MANFNIDYLVVGGGGGGGSANGASGSGGGAGEYLYKTGQTLSTGIVYTYYVSVGANGVGGATTGNNGYGAAGTQGASSSFNNDSAVGGGFGVSPYVQVNGGDGGSGGGANYPTYSPGSSTAVYPGLGNSGGAGNTVSGGAGAYGSGGGGGAAQAGFPGTTSVAGNGGDGIYNSITGTSTAYAAGGGGGIFAPSGQYTFGIGGSGGTGGSSSITNNASDGAPSTGSGGGGGSYATSANPYQPFNGGNGASGIVILRWLTTDAGYTVSGSNPTQTIDGAYTVLSFTAVVTSTITFTSIPTPTKMSSALVDFNSGTEDGLKLPSGDDANQPTGVGGMIRNNTDSGMSFYNGSDWQYFAATESPDVVYPTSLKMYLDASDTTSYPGTGTTWFDLTSNANNGIISGATFSPSNASFDFDGSNDYISFSQFNISSNNKVTVELWTNPDSSQVDYANMFDYGHDGTNGFTVQQNASSTNNYYVYNTGVLGTNSIPANTWTQFCFTGDGTNWKIYKNGALVSTRTSSVSANTTGRTLNIGRWLGGTARYWNGQISKVRIYDTPLSGIEVTALYNEGR